MQRDDHRSSNGRLEVGVVGDAAIRRPILAGLMQHHSISRVVYHPGSKSGDAKAFVQHGQGKSSLAYSKLLPWLIPTTR
jgi:hypothetical protein